MTLFGIPKIDKFGLMAFALIALAVPIYAVSSYEGTVETSVERWLSFYLIGTELAVITLAIFSGWRPIKTWIALPKYIRAALVIWVTTASFATVFSSNSSISAVFQFFWVVHGAFCLALWSMAISKWHGIQGPLIFYFAIGMIFHSICVYFVAWFILGPGVEEWQRYSVGTTNPRLYVFYADALLGIGLGLLIVARRPVIWFFAIGMTFAAYHLFAWSGGRASFATSLLIPALLAIFARSAWKRIIIVSFTCAVVAFPLSLITAPAHDIYGFESVIGRIAVHTAVDEYSSGRFDMWARMLAQGFEKPIFGQGQIGTLDLPKNVHSNFGHAAHAHNALVHIFHAWGALGLVAFGIGLFGSLASIRARLNADPLVAWPAFIALSALAVTSSLDGTLFFNQPLFFCATFIAILASVPADQSPLAEQDPANATGA